MSAKHTPGPVAMRYRHHYPDDGSKPYRTSEWQYTQGPWDKIPGNARDVSALYLHEASTQQPLTDKARAVIDAAPELLQALKDLKAAVMKYTSAPEDWPELAKALAAIEKAEGRA